DATQAMPVVSAIQANDTAVEAAQESGDEPANEDPAADDPTDEDPAAEDPAAEGSADTGGDDDTDHDADEADGDDDDATDHFPGDPEAARAALLAILYPDSDPVTAAPTASAPDETPTSPAEPDASAPAPTSLAALRQMDEDDYE